jgi:hypothetical protein
VCPSCYVQPLGRGSSTLDQGHTRLTHSRVSRDMHTSARPCQTQTSPTVHLCVSLLAKCHRHLKAVFPGDCGTREKSPPQLGFHASAPAKMGDLFPSKETDVIFKGARSSGAGLPKLFGSTHAAALRETWICQAASFPWPWAHQGWDCTLSSRAPCLSQTQSHSRNSVYVE